MARELGPGHLPEITEENLAESQARMRALILSRYELIWAVVEARIQEDRNEERTLDPRLLEIGRGILKEESALFRLGRAPAQVEEEPELELPLDERRELVARSLDDLEAKRHRAEAARQAARDKDQAA